MKTLVLNSSNRTNGNTAKALRVLLKSLDLPENDVYYIELGKQRIEICEAVDSVLKKVKLPVL